MFGIGVPELILLALILSPIALVVGIGYAIFKALSRERQ